MKDRMSNSNISILEHFRGLVSFTLANPAISAAYWFLGFMLMALTAPASNIQAVFVLLVTAIGGTSALYAYSRALEKRANTISAEKWDVIVNGIPHTSLSDAAYARIRREVLLDTPTFWRQVLNLGYVFVRGLSYLLIAVPIIAFWVIVCSFIADPTSVREMFSILSSAQLESSITRVMQMLVVISAAAMSFGVIFGAWHPSEFGLYGWHSHEFLERVIAETKCTASGTIRLARNYEPNTATA